MIVAQHDDTNIGVAFDAVELKIVHLLLKEITPQQSMVAAAALHEDGFSLDEKDVQAVVRSIVLNTQDICSYVSNRCPGCGEIDCGDEFDDESENGPENPPIN
jgi:hypothetical protein